MSRKSKEEIAAQKEASRQKLLAERRDQALQDYKGGVAAFVSVPVGDEAKRTDAEKLLRKASRAMKRAFENAADSMMMKISIDILKNK